LWAIDIGVSAMNTGSSVVSLCCERSAMDQYHLGLVTAQLSFLALSLFFVLFLVIVYGRGK
jgi:hypothetical protein